MSFSENLNFSFTYLQSIRSKGLIVLYRRTLFVFLGGKIASQTALVMHKYEPSHLPYDLKISDMWSIASRLMTASVLRGIRVGEGSYGRDIWLCLGC